MTRDLTAYELLRPPVTSVSLRIRFKAVPSLQNWMLASFLSEMRGIHASVEELPPLGGFTDPFSGLVEDDDGQEDHPAWPVPRTQFSGLDRTIAVQGDELQVTWAFDDESASKYVGFDALRGDMENLYRKLVNSVIQHGVTIGPKGVECFYVNSVPEVTATTLAVGVLTNWTNDVRLNDPQDGYVGVRLHTCASPNMHRCSSLVMVDSRDADDPPILSLRVHRVVDEGLDAIEALSDAHDELIALFKQHTSESLRKGWGEK